MKKIFHRNVIAAVTLALVTSIGCATEATSDDTTTDDTAEATQAVTGPTHSFSNPGSCEHAVWDYNSQVIQAIVSASATRCKRLNGTWNENHPHWSGTCFRDVSNCNGNIVCQTHCP